MRGKGEEAPPAAPRAGDELVGGDIVPLCFKPPLARGREDEFCPPSLHFCTSPRQSLTVSLAQQLPSFCDTAPSVSRRGLTGFPFLGMARSDVLSVAGRHWVVVQQSRLNRCGRAGDRL